MGCHFVKTGTDSMAVFCTRGHRNAPCSVPGCGRPHEVLCDYLLAPLEVGKEPRTCDAKLCRRCAKHVGPDRDLCPPHARMEGSK